MAGSRLPWFRERRGGRAPAGVAVRGARSSRKTTATEAGLALAAPPGRYVRALRAAGVDAYYKCYYEMHGFWGGVTTGQGASSLRETAQIAKELFTSR